MRLVISGIRDFYVVPGSELDYLVDVMVCDKTDGELAERIPVDDSDVELDEEGDVIDVNGWGKSTVKALSEYILSKEHGIRGYSS